ncbi:uncharacterized protein LOC119081113 [Bradysia coprophila]|uniref:uncharacterized protein LOC119081113 n=1 Tax=Bradysia coprophila TaxID=38358 RepID=UPI00187D9AD4|nr:uncharacterized protein LOC119081113 [Bradysia coprophila]
MKNTAYACNLENEIIQLHGEIDACTVRHYAAQHNGNQPAKIEQTMFLSTTNEDIEPVTFAHPMPIKKRRIVKTVEETSYWKANESICYTLSHADMIKIEQNSIFVKEIVEPKTKTKNLRKKKCSKRKNHEVANAWNWEDLSFQPEIEPKYDYNDKPNDYVQFLNNPICDPMFCQFDISKDKSMYSVAAHCEYDEYEVIVDEGSRSDDAKFADA